MPRFTQLTISIKLRFKDDDRIGITIQSCPIQIQRQMTLNFVKNDIIVPIIISLTQFQSFSIQLN